MKANEIIKRLTREGWVKRNQKGSHAHYSHPTKSGLVTVPMHKGDVKKGTLRSIFKQADWPWPP